MAALILAGSGFLGGYLAGGSGGDEMSVSGGFTQRVDGAGGPGGAMPANLTIGTIESISGNTFTVKTESGDTVKVQVVDDTTIRINKEGSITT